MDCNPGSELAISVGDAADFLRIIDSQTAAVKRVFGGPAVRGGELAAAPDGRWLASVSDDRPVVIRDSERGRPWAVVPAWAGEIRCVCFTPDGKHLVTGGEHGTLRLWSVERKERAPSLPAIAPGLTPLGVDASGREQYLHEKTGVRMFRLPGTADSQRTVLIGQAPVTWAEYRCFADLAPFGRTAMPGLQEAGCPVGFASYGDALAYCAWAGLRLPTFQEQAATNGADNSEWCDGGADATEQAPIRGADGKGERIPAETRRADLGFRVALTLEGGASAPNPGTERRHLARAQSEAFAWWDAVASSDGIEPSGSPGGWFGSDGDRPADIRSARLVEITSVRRTWGTGVDEEILTGMLLGEDEGSWTLFTQEGRLRQISRLPADSRHPEDAPRCRPLQLEAFGEALLELDGSGSDYSPGLTDFLVARVAAAQGLEDLAVRLCERAVQPPTPREKPVRTALLVSLQQLYGVAPIWRAVLAAGSLEVDRAALLDQFREVARTYGASCCGAEARQYVRVLERMVAEDAIRAQRPVRPADLPAPARALEWIERLRDQNGRQSMQPGACSVFSDERGWESPAYRLLAMGFDAVPALIEALPDDRLTRSVEYHRNFYYSHTVLRIGDACLSILEEITGERWWESGRVMQGSIVLEGTARDVQVRVREWWRRLQESAEFEQRRAQAMERVEKERRTWGSSADNHAIMARIELESADEKRGELIGRLQRDAEGRVEEFLRKQMDRPGSFESRLEIALFLTSGEGPENLGILEQEWSRVRNLDPALLDRRVVRNVVSRLTVGSGGETFRSVLRDHRRLPLKLRETILEGLSMRLHDGRLWVPCRNAGLRADAVQDDEAKGLARFCEQYLLERLDDAEGTVPLQTSDPRGPRSLPTREFAALLLERNWPDKYMFDPHATEPIRAFQIRIQQDTARAESGAVPLPWLDGEPADRTLDVKDGDVNTVVRIEAWPGSNVPVSNEILAELRTLLNTRPEAGDLKQVLRSAVSKLGEGTCTLELVGLRPAGRVGVQVLVRVGSDRPQRWHDWDADGHWGMEIDSHSVAHEFDGGAGWRYDLFEAKHEMAEASASQALDRLLDVPPDLPLCIRVRVTRRPK